jgi:hypothetical protein
MKELIYIQSKLRAPKSQYNSFGKYNYRSAEDILEAVKPLVHEQGCILTITDDLACAGDRVYIKATCRLTNTDGQVIETSAYAREDETKKGMDGSQITGSSSSYARKYALNGMFCIDDTKDADTRSPEQNTSKPTPTPKTASSKSDEFYLAKQEIESATSISELTRIYNTYTSLHTDADFMESLTTKKKGL